MRLDACFFLFFSFPILEDGIVSGILIRDTMTASINVIVVGILSLIFI